MRALRAVCFLLLLLLQTRCLPLLPHDFDQSYHPTHESVQNWPFQQERSEKANFPWRNSLKSAYSPSFLQTQNQKPRQQAAHPYRDQRDQKGYEFDHNPTGQEITPIFNHHAPWAQDHEWHLREQEAKQWHFQPNHHQNDHHHQQRYQQPWQFEQQHPQWREPFMEGPEAHLQGSASGPYFEHPKSQDHPPAEPRHFQQHEQSSQPSGEFLNAASGQFIGFPSQDFHPAQHNNFWSAPRSPFRGPYRPQNSIIYAPHYNNQPFVVNSHPPMAPHNSHEIPEGLVAGRFSPPKEANEQKATTEAVKEKEEEEVTTNQMTTPSFLPELDQWFKEHAAELEGNTTAKEEADSGAKLADFVKRYGPAIYEKLRAVQTGKASQ